MSDVPTIPAPEDDLALLHQVDIALRKESHPEDEPSPLADHVTACRHLPAHEAWWSWVALDTASGAPVGSAGVGFEHVPENQHLVWAEISVVPGHRQRGIARHLLSQVATRTATEGRSLILFGTWQGIGGGDHFAERLGADPGLVSRESELDLTTLDRGMIEDWVEQGPKRAPDYEIILFEGPLPESEYEPYAALREATNDAPRDGLEIEDDHMTPEIVAEREKRLAAGRQQRWSYLARRKGSRDYAGFTETFHEPWNPRVIGQGWTAVHADHRGHALGKWLKAAMLQKILEERPDAEVVRTDNAYSNDAMLGINIALGFAVTRTFTEWQVKLDQVVDYLRS